MKNQKFMVNHNFFSTKGCEAFKATFPRNCGETDGACGETWAQKIQVEI